MISEATMRKLVKVAEEDMPTEVLFPDEAKEILEELRYLGLQLLGETGANIILGGLTRESAVCRVNRLGQEEYRKRQEEERRKSKEGGT